MAVMGVVMYVFAPEMIGVLSPVESIEELEPTRFPEPPSEDNDEEPDGSDSENEGENLDPDAGKSEQQDVYKRQNLNLKLTLEAENQS